MLDGMQRIAEKHSGACISHHGLHFLFHIAAVAMHGAFAAGSFLFSKAAKLQAPMGILQKLLAIFTQTRCVPIAPTIKTYHLLYCALLIFYPGLHKNI